MGSGWRVGGGGYSFELLFSGLAIARVGVERGLDPLAEPVGVHDGVGKPRLVRVRRMEGEKRGRHRGVGMGRECGQDNRQNVDAGLRVWLKESLRLPEPCFAKTLEGSGDEGVWEERRR